MHHDRPSTPTTPTTPTARAAGERIRRAEHVRATWCGDELVLLDTRHDTYYTLNRVAGRLWDLLVRPKTTGELVRFLRAEYDVAPTVGTDVLEHDVSNLLRDLSTAELVVTTAPNAVGESKVRTPVAG